MRFRFTNWRVLGLSWGDMSSPAGAYREVTGAATKVSKPESNPHLLRPRPTLKIPSELSRIEERQALEILLPGRDNAPSIEELMNDLDRYFEGSEDILDHIRGAPVEWWDVVDESGQVLYQTWIWGVDCGQIYRANTLEDVAYVAQFDLWCEKDRHLWKALSLAHVDVRRFFPESELARMNFHGVSRCPGCQALNSVWVEADDDVVVCERCGERFNALASL